MENFLTKVMVGLAMVGESMNGFTESSMRAKVSVVTDQSDLELKCVFYWQTKKIEAETLEDLETPEVLQMLNRLKAMCRSDIKAIYEAADRQDKADLVAKLKETNKPHEMGTVSEIATKYGISKSEVRRRKADGTLHELKELVNE